MTKLKIAYSNTFLSAMVHNLPATMQNKMLRFQEDMAKNPELPGLNIEKLQQSRSENLYSARLSDDFRVIFAWPKQQKIMMLLWVDHHDAAYRWADRKTCAINHETGAIQIYDTAFMVPHTQTEKSQNPPLFDQIRDREFIQLGVPEELISEIRKIETEHQLDAIRPHIPPDVYDVLFALAAGMSVEEVYQECCAELKADPETPVDIQDWDQALQNPASKRLFFVPENDLEMQAIINAPLEQWRVFLHPSQRQVVEKNWSGPVRVTGGAGTGKTVAAIHRAKYLATHVFKDKHDRILFTTFTKNLAMDIEAQLKTICDPHVATRIEVINIDAWITRFLQSNGYPRQIAYEKWKDRWDKAVSNLPAIDIPPHVFREEWEYVIQPNDILTLNDYIKVSRAGRGIRLSRQQRLALWSVFEDYRARMSEDNLSEPDDASRDALSILQNSVKNKSQYRAVIVDEGQDMSPQALRLIRALVPEGENDIFIVGDSHQRIYRHKVPLSRCGINVRGRSRTLKINYRTTEETRDWAVRLLHGLEFDDLDGTIIHQKGYKSLCHGDKPEIQHFATFQEEMDYIIQLIPTLCSEPTQYKNICITVSTKEAFPAYEDALKKAGLPVLVIKRSNTDNQSHDGIRLATMHRVKGLEFDYMIIASVNDGLIPSKNAESTDDPMIKSDFETRERSLLYVAATRAKKQLFVTSYGVRSRFLG